MTTRGTAPKESPGRALVVDDEPKNRELLRDLLVANGYSVVEAEDGIGALEKADGNCDVILLDVMMPRMDGLEACRQLKANPETAHIPVLMVTALTEKEQRHQGIAAGANDYLTKPIDRQDVLLRVRNAVAAKRLHDTVQRDLDKLRELEQLRDNLTHMIIRDMRSPLMAIMGGIQLPGDKLKETDEDKRFANMAASAAQELNEMVTSLLDISRMESGEMPLNLANHDLQAIAQAVVESNRAGAEFENVRLTVSGDSATARFDKDLIHRVFSNLIGNAIKVSPAGSAVELHIRPNEEVVRAEVTDTGRGIPEEYREKIFEKFGQVEARKHNEKHSTGLGLAFCKLAVEAHGGRIGVDSEVAKGSAFWFELPLNGPPPTAEPARQTSHPTPTR